MDDIRVEEPRKEFRPILRGTNKVRALEKASYAISRGMSREEAYRLFNLPTETYEERMQKLHKPRIENTEQLK